MIDLEANVGSHWIDGDRPRMLVGEVVDVVEEKGEGMLLLGRGDVARPMAMREPFERTIGLGSWVRRGSESRRRGRRSRLDDVRSRDRETRRK